MTARWTDWLGAIAGAVVFVLFAAGALDSHLSWRIRAHIPVGPNEWASMCDPSNHRAALNASVDLVDTDVLFALAYADRAAQHTARANDNRAPWRGALNAMTAAGKAGADKLALKYCMDAFKMVPDVRIAKNAIVFADACGQTAIAEWFRERLPMLRQHPRVG